MTLQSKTALVTGAASGIGLAISQTLAARGWRVILVDLNQAAGEAAAERVNGRFFRADLANRTACKELIDGAGDAANGIDILINNAGFQHIDALEDFPEEAWERMMAVMLTAPFLLTKYVWPSMKRKGWGRVVNISSIHGRVASPYKVGYVAAKHGLIGLTRTAALEGGEFGITVNAICPAYVRTPLVEDQIAAHAHSRGIGFDEVVERVMLEPAAIKRLIEPAEIGELVAYLCSDAAGAITGADWSIDLGWTAR